MSANKCDGNENYTKISVRYCVEGSSTEKNVKMNLTKKVMDYGSANGYAAVEVAFDTDRIVLRGDGEVLEQKVMDSKLTIVGYEFLSASGEAKVFEAAETVQDVLAEEKAKAMAKAEAEKAAAEAAQKAAEQAKAEAAAELAKMKAELEAAAKAKAEADAAKAEIERIKAETEKARLEMEKAKAEAEKAAAEAAQKAVEQAKAEANVEVEAAKKTTQTSALPKGSSGICVVLKNAGAAKLRVLKVVVQACGLNMLDAKNKVDSAPCVVKDALSRTEAINLKEALIEAGADAEVVFFNGSLPGSFTLRNGKKISFSRGLLQFNPAKYEFRFAENQYDIIGKDNEKIAPNYDGWIDLFGWGTSGYMGCQPTEVSTNANEYGPVRGDITGTNYDWGVYNPILNGGNQKGIWRTMTEDEFEYIIKYRPNASKLKAECSVCGVGGCLLLPDNFWDNRVCIPIDTTSSTNQYTAEQFCQLEAIGVVFMPYAGRRYDKEYKDDNNVGWLSTSSGFSQAYYGLSSGYNFYYKYRGISVRLVQDVE